MRKSGSATGRELSKLHRSIRSHLDEAEDPSYSKDPDDPQKGGANGKVGEHILKEDASDGRENEDEVEQVPRHRKVVVAKSNDFHNSLCEKKKSNDFH